MKGAIFITIFIILGIGILIGWNFFPIKNDAINSKIQLVLIGILIFSMGVSLGSRAELMDELKTLGIQSLAFSCIPIIFSVLLAFLFTRKVMEDKNDHHSDS